VTLPRLNAKYLLGLCGILLLLAGGLYFLHRFQLKRNAGALLTQSQRAEEQGRVPQAAEYLSRYVRLAPHDLDALHRYGRLLDRLAPPLNPSGRLRAFLTLERVLQQQPDRTDVRHELVRIAMAPDLGRFSDARHHLQTLLRDTPGRADLELLLGRCYDAQREYSQAVECYRKVIKHDPAQIEAYTRLAAVLRHQLKQRAEANEVMDAAVRANAGSAPAYLARAHYRRAAGMLELAAADLAQARKLAPEDVATLLQSAELARAAGKLDAAREHLREGLKRHPHEASFYLSLAVLETQSDRAAEAVACLREGLAKVPGHSELLWNLADLLLQRGEQKEPAQTVAQLRRRGFTPALLDYLDARLLVARSEWLRAASVLERIQPALERWPAAAKEASLLLGRCHEQVGDADRQYAAYRRVVTAEPLSVPGCLGLASALATLGKIEDALEVYQRIVSRVPEVRLMRARLLILQNLRLPPAERNWEKAEDLLKSFAAARADESAVPILEAEVRAGQGELDKAHDLLLAARERHPKELQIWLALAGVADRQGRPKAALDLLEEAGRRLGDSVSLRLAKARHWARQGSAARKALARLEREGQSLPAADRPLLDRGLAEAYAQADLATDAYRLWGHLAEQQPHDLRLQLILFDRARQTGDEEAMSQLTERMYRVEGASGTLWRYGKLCQLIRRAEKGEKQTLNEARSLLTAITGRRPAWARLPLCEAQINELSGNPSAAIPSYLRALELGERSPQVIDRAVRLLYQRRRFVEADRILRKLPEQTPLSAGLQRLAAELSLRTAAGPQDYGRALELARKAVPADSKDYRDHIWLGQLHWAAGRLKEAEGSLRHAVALAEKAPDPWVALVHYLARTGQRAAAEEAARQAGGKMTGEQAPLALAQCEEAVGRVDRAGELYRAALKARPEDLVTLGAVAGFCLRQGDRDEAGKHLRRIIDLKSRAPAEAAWARRTLAVLLASGGSVQDSRKALEVLGLVEGDGPPQAAGAVSPEDQRTRAVILAAQKGPAPRRQAVRLLEDLFARQPPSAEDQYFLAQLYESVGDWPNARRWLAKLAPAQERNAAFLDHYARGLIRHGEAEEARAWVERLGKVEPGSFRYAELKARVLVAAGQAKEALAGLRAYAGTKGARPEQVAGLLEELGQPDAAGELYQAYAQQAGPPEKVLVLAGYLGRRGKTREALDLCAAAWDTCVPEAVAHTCLAALHAKPEETSQRERVAGWLKAARAKHPDRLGLLAHQAALHNLEGRYAEAAATYQKLLERAPGGVGTLNNLAWLLAVHQGKTGEALGLIGKAIEMEGPAPYLLDTRGVIYLLSGTADLAVKDLQQAVTEAPTASRYFHLAQAHARARDVRAARRDLQRAQTLGLSPDHLHALERSAYERLLAELSRR
jgi:tetratricopeptide (TPR) repeat protein